MAQFTKYYCYVIEYYTKHALAGTPDVKFYVVPESDYGVSDILQAIAAKLHNIMPREKRGTFAIAFTDAIYSTSQDITHIHWKFLAGGLKQLPYLPTVDTVITGLQLLASGKKWAAAADAATTATTAMYAIYADATTAADATYVADAAGATAYAAYAAYAAAAAAADAADATTDDYAAYDDAAAVAAARRLVQLIMEGYD